jgi:tetratricopeptide (TPR) repeat protein
VAKKTEKSNVVQFPKGKKKAAAAAGSSDDNLELAQQKVYEAWEVTGKKRIALANQALKLHEDCADAYTLLASEEPDEHKRIELYRKAVAAGERALGPDWEKEFAGVCWGVIETRPVMRAMARLACSLQQEFEFEESLEWYRKLIRLNPDDNQGVRYLFAGCLYEADKGDELEKLLDEYNDDPSAALLYTKALHVFRMRGDCEEAKKALMAAFDSNNYVPLFLSDVVEMPDEAPDSIGFGDESEAVAYVVDNGHLWWSTAGANPWMAETLALKLNTVVDDPELIQAAIESLKDETVHDCDDDEFDDNHK